MQEVTLTSIPNQIRRLFVTLLIFGDPAVVTGLIYRHFEAIAKDQRLMIEKQMRFRIIS
jgi:hypothetical protein